MITSLPGRLGNRAIREAVERLRVPPARVGYRHLKAETPAAYVRRLGQQKIGTAGRYESLEPRQRAFGPLPMNIASRSELSRTLPSFALSFFDVPDRLIGGTALVTIPNCRIAVCHDEWGHEFYVLVTEDDRLLQVRGTSFRSDHARILRSGKGARIKRASWILEIWANNYFHWLVYHLPKIALLMEYGLADQVLLPKQNRSYSIIESSLERLGLESSSVRRLDEPLIQVDELTFVEVDYVPARLLNRVRDRIAGPAASCPDRLVFVSREKATRRRLNNEYDVWPILEQAGYERVEMEALSFYQQVALMRNTRVLVATSGAGLANMLFCRAGTHVVELSDADYLSADFYALAGALGHHYWLLPSRGVGLEPPGARDLVADPSAVREVVRRIG